MDNSNPSSPNPHGEQLRQMMQELIPRFRQNGMMRHIREWNSTTTCTCGTYDRNQYYDLPLLEVDDLNYVNGQDSRMVVPSPDLLAFESACRDGPLTQVHSITSSRHRTPAFLHNGLAVALRAGNAESAGYLLSIGAPVVRETAKNIFAVPENVQVPLFELLLLYGWNPDIPDTVDQFFVPSVISNPPVLRLLLTHGANPNLGKIGPEIYDFEGRETNGSCEALEKAAYHGHFESVRLLLDAGANINNGFPLHAAAGSLHGRAFPAHAAALLGGRVDDTLDPHDRREFEEGQAAIMALLVERGADVNLWQKVLMGSGIPGYPVLEALWAGSIERTRWLLDHGADPEVRGVEGTATDLARMSKNQELITLVEERIRAKRAARGEEPEQRS